MAAFEIETSKLNCVRSIAVKNPKGKTRVEYVRIDTAQRPVAAKR